LEDGSQDCNHISVKWKTHENADALSRIQFDGINEEEYE